MPVSYHAAGENDPFYLIPAPFVNISKNFDKSGNGEILGTNYQITLTGTLVAERGSPKKDGKFVTDGADPAKEKLEVAQHYKALQAKQKALARLFSKKNEGGLLHVEHVAGDGSTGFKCWPSIESIDFPSHGPSNPSMSEYTITLSANHLVGVDGKKDPDDWGNADKWLINSATETWDIQEDEMVVINRSNSDDEEKDPVNGECKDDGGVVKAGLNNQNDCLADGTCKNHPALTRKECLEKEYTWTRTWVGDPIKEKITDTKKIYRITRTLSAVGKRKFDRDTDKAEGLNEEFADGSEDKFFTKLDSSKDQQAWQQARGFVYEMLQYGKSFVKGDDDSSAVDATATPAVDNTGDDYDVNGLNIPSSYTGYNYGRNQTVDKLGGSFQITENWVFAPDTHNVIESIDFNVSEDPNSGVITMQINGSIEGLVPPPDPAKTYSDIAKGMEDDVDQKFNLDAAVNSRFEYARKHYDSIERELYSTCKNLLTELQQYKPEIYGDISIHKVPTSKSIAFSPATGIITYNYSFETRHPVAIPGCLTETIDVNDTYPGRVFASTPVIGRKWGPVLQNINTQTEWKRSLNLTCTVNTLKEYNEDESLNSNKVSITGGYGNAMAAKPSNVPEQMAAIKDIIDTLSPKGQIGVTSWFVDPSPTEGWNPRTGSWSYSISWTYELKNDSLFDPHSVNIGSYGQYPSRWRYEDDSGDVPGDDSFTESQVDTRHKSDQAF